MGRTHGRHGGGATRSHEAREVRGILHDDGERRGAAVCPDDAAHMGGTLGSRVVLTARKKKKTMAVSRIASRFVSHMLARGSDNPRRSSGSGDGDDDSGDGDGDGGKEQSATAGAADVARSLVALLRRPSLIFTARDGRATPSRSLTSMLGKSGRSVVPVAPVTPSSSRDGVADASVDAVTVNSSRSRQASRRHSVGGQENEPADGVAVAGEQSHPGGGGKGAGKGGDGWSALRRHSAERSSAVQGAAMAGSMGAALRRRRSSIGTLAELSTVSEHDMPAAPAFQCLDDEAFAAAAATRPSMPIFAVSASADKTVRGWRCFDGTLVKLFKVSVMYL